MNNYEKIKNMNIDEMAEFINNLYCRNECDNNWSCFDCFERYKQWLQEESKDKI